MTEQIYGIIHGTGKHKHEAGLALEYALSGFSVTSFDS
jgi:hypothetical protein